MKDGVFFLPLWWGIAINFLLDLCSIQHCWAWYAASVLHKREKKNFFFFFSSKNTSKHAASRSLLRLWDWSIVFPLATHI